VIEQREHQAFASGEKLKADWLSRIEKAATMKKHILLAPRAAYPPKSRKRIADARVATVCRRAAWE
jgi:hypothetical protein